MPTFLGFQTLDDLENYYYGGQYNQEVMNKAQGGISTDTTGTFNTVFGAMVWANFNLEANLFGCLPKYPWQRSGWRILTAKADDVQIDGTKTALTGLGGTPQGGKIADAQHPVYQEVSVLPKTVQYVIQSTDVTENLVGTSMDDVTGSLGYQRVYAADQIKELLNRQLLFNPLDTAVTDDAADLLERQNMESINRVVASKEEYDESGSSIANIYNPWRRTASITRNTSDTWDSTIESPSGDLGTSDVITNGIIVDTLADLRTAGGKEPTFLVGGQDTYSELQKLYINAYRIENQGLLRDSLQVNVNGISTFDGTGVGLHISTVYGLPYIPTKDATPGRTSGDAGNLYILNTSADRYDPTRPLLGIQTLKPILYYEASERQPIWPFSNDSFTNRAVYEALLELTCTNFKAQGKIVNIKRGA